MKTEKTGCNPNPQCGECANNRECQQLAKDTSPSPEPETEKPPPISSEWGEKYRRAIAVTDGGSSGVDARRAVILPSLAAEPPRAAEVLKDEIAVVAPPPDNNRTCQLDLAAWREEWAGGQQQVTSSDGEGREKVEQIFENPPPLPIAVLVIGKERVTAGGGAIGYSNQQGPPIGDADGNEDIWHELNNAHQDALQSLGDSDSNSPSAGLFATNRQIGWKHDSGGSNELALASVVLRDKVLRALKHQLHRYACTLNARSVILAEREKILAERERLAGERLGGSQRYLEEWEELLRAKKYSPKTELRGPILYFALFLFVSAAVLVGLYMTPRGSEVGAFLSKLIPPTQSLSTEEDTLYGGGVQVAEDVEEFVAVLDASGNSAVEDLPPLVPLAPEEEPVIYTEPYIICEFAPPVSAEDPEAMSIWYGTTEILEMNESALAGRRPTSTLVASLVKPLEWPPWVTKCAYLSGDSRAWGRCVREVRGPQCE